jgi:ABC-2 type transport system permease protein
MRSLIAAELLKVRTTRALWIAAAVVLAYAVLGPVLVAAAPSGASVPALEPALLAESLRTPARLAGGALLLLGLLSATAEFAHGTVHTTRLAEPHSTRVLAAKVVALSVVGLVFGVMVGVVSMAATGGLLAAKGVAIEPLAHGVPRLAGLLLVLTVLHAALGVAIGSLLRSTAAAVGTVLMWAFVVEGVLPVVARRPEITTWLPSGAVSQVLAEHAPPGGLGPWGAAALLLGYAVVLVAASVATDRARELQV